VSALNELTSHLTGGSRVIVISEKDVNLKPEAADNRLVLMKLAEGSLAAGGRGGGFGERRVVKVAIFQIKRGVWQRVYETKDESSAAEFEIPYHVSRLPFTLADGTESIGYGVVDPELVAQMASKAGAPSSA
jgi:hypothetical protein